MMLTHGPYCLTLTLHDLGLPTPLSLYHLSPLSLHSSGSVISACKFTDIFVLTGVERNCLLVLLFDFWQPGSLAEQHRLASNSQKSS